MSAGHRAHRDDVPEIDDAFYRRVKNLVDACKVDRNRTIPWLANRTRDYRIVWVDQIVPENLPKTGINTGLTLPYHELGEQLGMDEGLEYDTAHATRGNPCEKRRVEELGGDWDAYQAEMADYIRDVDDEAMTDVPSDLDTRVFADDHDQAALDEIAEDNHPPKGFGMTIQRKFVAGAVVPADASLGARQILVVASDGTVDRAKDVMVPSGCKIENYQRNNIVLADHDPTKPIGNSEITITPQAVRALITFAPEGISAKADEYCALAKAGVIKAVSVGFDPIEAEPRKDGGFIYKQWELMELSVLGGVPCNPSATVIARSLPAAAPATSAPKPEWKIGASLNLPLSADSAAGDPCARATGILDKAGRDWTWARKGFLAYDAANPGDRKAYDIPFAEVVDGRMVVTRASLGAAAAAVAKLPAELRTKAGAVIIHYEAKMKTKAGAPKIKGLYDVCELARLVSNLGYIHDCSTWEAEAEQDGSKLPAMLAEALQKLAAALVAMTAEETAELLAGRGIEVMPADEAYVAAAPTPQAKALRAGFRKAAHVLKAGRALSAANLSHMVEMHKCFGKMAECSTKMADLHDDIHAVMEEWMNHGTSAGDHHKAVMKSAGKKPDGSDDDDEGDVSDPADADNELSADAAQRKRELELLERSAA